MGEDEKSQDSGADPGQAPSSGSPQNRASTVSGSPKSGGSTGGSLSPPPEGHNLRIVFAFAWVIVQLVLVITADRRADGAFGFRMFPESSWMKVVLYREVDVDPHIIIDHTPSSPTRTRIHVDNGVWGARNADGVLRQINWYNRVPAPYWIFDRDLPASYGAATQLERLQAALDDVASHTPEDAESHRLLLEVTIHRNGREAVVHQLASKERPLPTTTTTTMRSVDEEEWLTAH